FVVHMPPNRENQPGRAVPLTQNSRHSAACIIRRELGSINSIGDDVQMPWINVWRDLIAGFEMSGCSSHDGIRTAQKSFHQRSIELQKVFLAHDVAMPSDNHLGLAP